MAKKKIKKTLQILSTANFFSKSFLTFRGIIRGRKKKESKDSSNEFEEDNARFAVTLILGT